MNNKMNTIPKPQRVKQQLSKQVAARNGQKRRRGNKPLDVVPYVSNVKPYPQPQSVSTGNIRKVMSQRMITRLTPDGMAFLKCAFAPPDFQNSKLSGVPDEFQGRSLVKKHRSINSLSFASANIDTYILLLPTPGYAYWVATTLAGVLPSQATSWQGIAYRDSESIFDPQNTPGLDCADSVNRYRFVSNHIEFIPTTNQMSWTGNIQSWKMPVQLAIRQTGGAGGGDIWTVTGLRGVQASNADQYTGPFNLGLYAGCYNSSSKFDFQTILENCTSVPNPVIPGIGDWGNLNGSAVGFTGLDNNFESMVLKISGMGPNITNTAILKTWACVEYQVVTGTSLYEYQTFSPCDLQAVALYRKIINELPVGVSYMDNENFWRRILDIIRRASGAMSILPGPYGMAAGGVNMIASAIDQLAL